MEGGGGGGRVVGGGSGGGVWGSAHVQLLLDVIIQNMPPVLLQHMIVTIFRFATACARCSQPSDLQRQCSRDAGYVLSTT